MDSNELIRKAITDNISEDELQELRKILDAQPELREELQIEHAMYDFRNKTLKKELKTALHQRTKSNPKTYIIWTTLFILIILGLIAYFGSQDSYKAEESAIHFAANQLEEKSVSPLLIMDDEVKKVDPWTQAATAYAAGQYEEALLSINTIDNPNDEQRFYAGLCNIYADHPDYDSANRIMKSLQIVDDNLLYDQALWYGALTDILLGRDEEAQKQLRNIVNAKLWKQDEAKELLRLLDIQ